MKILSTVALIIAVLLTAGLFYESWSGWDKPMPGQLGQRFTPEYFNLVSVIACAFAVFLDLLLVLVIRLSKEIEGIGEVDKQGTLVLRVFICQDCGEASRRAHGWRCPKCRSKKSKKATFRIPSSPEG